jgi:hypothetical protein
MFRGELRVLLRVVCSAEGRLLSTRLTVESDGISSPSSSNMRGGCGEEGSAMASNAWSASHLECIQESYVVAVPWLQ